MTVERHHTAAQEEMDAASGQAQPPAADSRPDTTKAVTRGARRALAHLGYSSLLEVSLKGGRRADILAVSQAGDIAIVEVKSGQADYAADAKWPDYLGFCDRFYFAVPKSFPEVLIPADCGLMIADAYEAVVVREPPEHRLPGARRRAVLLKIARLGADRLHALDDPGFLEF